MSTFLPAIDDECTPPGSGRRDPIAVEIPPNAARESLVEIAYSRLMRLHKHLDNLCCISAESETLQMAEFIDPMVEEVCNLLAAAMEPHRPRRAGQQARKST